MNDRLGRRGRRPLWLLTMTALLAGLFVAPTAPVAAEPRPTCKTLAELAADGRPTRALELIEDLDLDCSAEVVDSAIALRQGARALMRLADRLEAGTDQVTSSDVAAFACVETLPTTARAARRAANACDRRVKNPEPRVRTTCQRMRTLIEDAYPQLALRLDPDKKCRSAQKAATAAQQRATDLVGWILTDGDEDRPEPPPAAPATTCAPEAPEDSEAALAMVLACDRQTVDLQQARDVVDRSWWERFVASWAELLTGLGPVWKLVAAWVLWVALGLALVKAAIATMGNRAIGKKQRSVGWWRIGFGCLALGGAAAILGASAPAEEAFDAWVAAAVLSLVGMGLMAQFWRTQPRLVVWSSNENAVASSAVATIARELGSQGPSGIKVPIGPDTSFVESVGLKHWSGNPVVAALAVLEDLVKPVNPWRLEVEAIDGQRIITRLLRNRREVAGMRVFSGVELLGHLARIPAPADAPGLPLAAFPAAHAVMEMAKGHELMEQCAGATSSVSIALQYLGARLESTDPRRLPVFQAAVGRDAGNQTAWLSYLHDCYRDETRRDELMRYRKLLAQLLPVVSGAPARTVTETEARARLARLAAGINAGLTAQLATEGANAVAAAARLVQEAGEDAAKKEFAEACLDAATAMVASVRPPTDPPTEPDTQGAAVNYSWACYWATVGGPEAQRQEREDRAVAFLRQADADPDRKEWKRKDPQLTEFRRTETYVKAFPSDFFDLPPAKARQGILAAAGLTTPAAVAGATPAQLEAVGIKGAEAVWLQELARLWALVPTQSLDAWRGELLRVVVTAGWPPVADPRTDVLTKLLAVVPTNKAADVTTWWNGLQPSPQP